MTKILNVIGGLNLGGAETMTINYLKNMDLEKIHMDFLQVIDEECYYDKEVISLGSKVFKISKKDNKPWKIVGEIRKIIKANGPYDVVHTQTLFNSGWSVKAAHIEKVPMIITHSHSTQDVVTPNFIRKLYYILMRKYINKYSNLLIACGLEAGNYLFGKKVFESNGIILKNAIDVERFQNPNMQIAENIKQELKINEKELVLVNVARFVEVKNHKFIIQIARELKARSTLFKILLIGNGKLFDDIKKLVKEYSLDQEVLFLGASNKIPEILSISDIFIMPSFFEGLPVTLIEAQSAGVKCLISSNITDEVDMGVNKIVKLDINNLNDWVIAIEKEQKGTVNDKKFIKTKITEKGYNIMLEAIKLQEIYEGIHIKKSLQERNKLEQK